MILRKPLPDPFPGDIVLFLHIVPIMAAVAIRPHQADEREGMLPSTLNVLILLVWWVVVYAFFVFPEEYIVTNVAVYSPRWDLAVSRRRSDLDCCVRLGILYAVGSVARTLSQHFFRHCSLHILFGSHQCRASRAALTRLAESTTSPFLAAVLGFFWVAIPGRQLPGETQSNAFDRLATHRQVAPQLAKLAMLSLPVMGYWALFLSHEQPYLRQFALRWRWAASLFSPFVVFLKQHLLDQRLLQLLKHSRKSFDNLQRLQGRVIQQAKLASLGELVALAAGELEFPLSAILSSSERMAASSNLSREQLANAQKIGQQARRTRELVSDLLSFSQQTPGEKVPLELKTLLQRAVQMEGFKLENKKISLTVESNDMLPCRACSAIPTSFCRHFFRSSRTRWTHCRKLAADVSRVSLWREETRGGYSVCRFRPGPARSRARFRSFLHHQAGRQRHRPWTQRYLRRDPGPQGTNHLLQPPRRRSGIRNPAAGAQSHYPPSGSCPRLTRLLSAASHNRIRHPRRLYRKSHIVGPNDVRPFQDQRRLRCQRSI